MVITARQIAKPVRQSTAAGGLYARLLCRYELKTLLAVPPLVHPSPDGTRAGHSASITISRHTHPLTIRVSIRAHSQTAPSYLQTLRMSAITLESLLNTNHALHHLVAALWSVYHSNNLRLSQSFLSLIHAATERHVNWQTLPPLSLVRRVLNQTVQTARLYSHLITETRLSKQSVALISGETHRHLSLLRERFVPFVPGGVKTSVLRSNRVISQTQVLSRLSLLEKLTERSRASVTLRETLLTQAWLVPILQRLYEGMESNHLFYSASSYQSVRTLYRLTNSLWKVYNSQNLELSRSFTRLINTVTEKNIQTRIERERAGMFSSTRSLTELVGALRSIFSGNNIQLRNNLVSLVQDINEAGTVNRHTKNTRVRNELHLHMPRVEERYISMRHKTGARREREANTALTKEIERVLGQKLSALQTPQPVPARLELTEALYQSLAQRLKREQNREWRYEKLQRGLF